MITPRAAEWSSNVSASVVSPLTRLSSGVMQMCGSLSGRSASRSALSITRAMTALGVSGAQWLDHLGAWQSLPGTRLMQNSTAERSASGSHAWSSAKERGGKQTTPLGSARSMIGGIGGYKTDRSIRRSSRALRMIGMTNKKMSGSGMTQAAQRRRTQIYYTTFRQVFKEEERTNG